MTSPHTFDHAGVQANRTLILLDVDGVLVHPVGYKLAVQETVAHFAVQMGQPRHAPSLDDISVFEACGITNEWDSGAICTAAILAAALKARPELARPTFEATLAAVAESGILVTLPPFAEIARAVRMRLRDGEIPAAVYFDQLAEDTPSEAVTALSALLADVYSIETPTTRHFQTRTLGSARFAETYRSAAPFEAESYLVTHDVPLLDEAHRSALLDWATAPAHGAVIYTARPSLAPAKAAGDGDYAPEAELATELLDVAGRIPLLGQGRMAWLAAQRGRPGPAYIKPSPVQALAAIGAAVSGDEHASLLAAAAFYEDGSLEGPLANLREGSTRVVICEDSPGGVQAGHRAADLLQSAGLAVTFEGIGISPHAEKRAALGEVAAHVVDDINAALDLVIG